MFYLYGAIPKGSSICFRVHFWGVGGFYVPSHFVLYPESSFCESFSVAPSESERDGIFELKFHLSFVAATTRITVGGGKKRRARKEEGVEADEEAHALFGSAFSGLFFMLVHTTTDMYG